MFNEDKQSEPKNPLIYQEKNIYFPELIVNYYDCLDRFKCGLCRNICDDPRYQYCGCPTAFCKRCLDLYYDSNHNKCPKCKKETRELMPSDSFNELILDLNIKCKNSNCGWVGKIKYYKEHIREKCPKEFINCPNKGCIFKSRREEMPNHILKCNNIEYICNKCQLKIKKAEKNSHINVCPKEKIKCSKGCGEYIERENLILHEKRCPNSYIDCPYSFIGCQDKILKKEIEEKIIQDTSKHLSLAIEKIQNLSDEIKELKNEINILKNDNQDLKKLTDGIIELLKKNGFLGIKENNIFSEAININSSNDSSKSCLLLSKKRLLSLDENEKNSNCKDFFLFKDNKEKDDKEKEKANILDNNIKINENDCIYSFIGKTRDLFTIKNNIIETNHLAGDKHYFVFYNKKYDIPKTSNNKFSFRIKLLQNIDFLGIGICDKKSLEKNDYEYDIKKTNKKRNIGLYIININQLVWNSNNMCQCTKLNYKKLSKKDTFIDCKLSPSDCELEFMINNEFFFVLNDIRCVLSEYFSPCLIFLKNGSVETEFQY